MTPQYKGVVRRGTMKEDFLSTWYRSVFFSSCFALAKIEIFDNFLFLCLQVSAAFTMLSVKPTGASLLLLYFLLCIAESYPNVDSSSGKNQLQTLLKLVCA